MRQKIELRGFLVTATAIAMLVGSLLFSTAAWAAEERKEECEEEEGWIPLFNGEDLEGWEQVGESDWKVEDGCLVGKQGPGNTPGDFFTKEEFDDFEVAVVFMIVWPANSGVWFRYQAPDKAYQADILEYKNPECYAGTIYCPGKMFLAMNEDPDLVKRDDWNTLKIRAEGDHLVVTLNDTVTGDVHEDSFKSGKIGFQIHAGDQFKDMKITIREVKIRKLSE